MVVAFGVGVATRRGANIENVRAVGNCNGIDLIGQAIVTRSIGMNNQFGIAFRGNTLFDRNIAQNNVTDAIRPQTEAGAEITPDCVIYEQIRPTVEPEQFAATGIGTFAASMPSVIGD